MKNIATIEHVLSQNFIRTAVRKTKTTTLELAALELQYEFNALHEFKREILSQDSHNVEIDAEDVRRAVALARGVVLPEDEIGLVYNWIRAELPLTVNPSEDKVWAKFVDYVKTKNLFHRFAHLDSKEVRRLFSAVYRAVGKQTSVTFYA